jgi:hypothetical protein
MDFGPSCGCDDPSAHGRSTSVTGSHVSELPSDAWRLVNTYAGHTQKATL